MKASVFVLSNQTALGKIFEHEVAQMFLLLFYLLILAGIFGMLIKDAIPSWKQSGTEGGGFTAKMIAISGNILLGFLAVVIVFIISAFTLKDYLTFLQPVGNKLLEFFEFIWNLFPWR